MAEDKQPNEARILPIATKGVNLARRFRFHGGPTYESKEESMGINPANIQRPATSQSER